VDESKDPESELELFEPESDLLLLMEFELDLLDAVDSVDDEEDELLLLPDLELDDRLVFVLLESESEEEEEECESDLRDFDVLVVDDEELDDLSLDLLVLVDLLSLTLSIISSLLFFLAACFICTSSNNISSTTYVVPSTTNSTNSFSFTPSNISDLPMGIVCPFGP